jgi:hypothetical protein
LAVAADTGVAVEVIGDRTLRSERRVLYRLWWQLEHADIAIVGIMPPGKI